MGSYPLAALHVNPPQQQADPVEQYSRLMQLKQQQQEAPLRQQALQQQVQSGQNQLQDQQDAEKSRKAMMQAYTEANGDLTKTIPLAAKYGAAPEALVKLQQAAVEQKTANLKLFQEQGNAAVQQADLYQGAHETVDKAPPEQKPAIYQQQVAALQQAGVDTSKLPPQYPGDEAFKVIGIGLKGHKAQLDELAKQLDMKKTGAQTDEAAAKAQEATVNASLAPQKVANEQAYRGAELRQGAQRIGIEGGRLNAENAKLAFEQKRAGMTGNADPDALSQAIATGHITPDRMGYLLSKNPGLLEGVLKADPSFDSSKAQAYPAIYKDFTSGKASVALNAGGTALGHLQELANMNTVQSHIPGTPDYNAYQNKADTVSSELAKFYGDATIPAIAAIKKTLTATLPGNRQAAIKTQAQSMGDKMDAFQQQWDNAAPSKAYQAPMPGISDHAKAARSALSGESQGGAAPLAVKAPNGKTYTFKDQASADAFKQKAGIQ